MRFSFPAALALLLAAALPALAPCRAETVENPAAAGSPAPAALLASVVRVNSTQQSWNPGQPWEKNSPSRRRALAAMVGPNRALTTAELVADATFLEFESPDGTRFAPAKVVAVDYEANLALLEPDGEAHAGFFHNARPLEIASPARIGDTLEMFQVEENGEARITTGTLRSVDVTPNFLPTGTFLTYLVKASMQSAASSYSLPVLRGGKLAGVLLSYDSNDQLVDAVSTDVLRRFLTDAMSGEYRGFPSLGVAMATTEDVWFRRWLGLSDEQGGVYLNRVRKGTAAEAAGLLAGDVLLAVDGIPIDRRGYYEHPDYGNLFWSQLIRGEKAVGDSVRLSLLREGKPLEKTATLAGEDSSGQLVPSHMIGQAPPFLVKGGLIFQELTRPLLEAYGKEWESRAPLNLLDVYENPEKYEDQYRRVVFLSGTIPTPATVGYERLRNLIVRQVNGTPIRDMASLIAAFGNPEDGLHTIEFDDENLTIHLDEQVSSQVDAQLLRQGLSTLSRAE